MSMLKQLGILAGDRLENFFFNQAVCRWRHNLQQISQKKFYYKKVFLQVNYSGNSNSCCGLMI